MFSAQVKPVKTLPPTLMCLTPAFSPLTVTGGTLALATFTDTVTSVTLAGSSLTGTTGDRYFDLTPDDAEWTEARRLAQKFGADAVVLGHTHSARWKQEPGLAFVNTGTWIHLMRLPAATDADTAWLGFLDQIRRNPSLDPARGPAAPLVTRFTGLVIHENPAGGALLQLVEWRAGAAPAVLASGAVAPHGSAA